MKRYVIIISPGMQSHEKYWRQNGGDVVGSLNEATWFTSYYVANREIENIPRKYDAVIFELVEFKTIIPKQEVPADPFA